MTELEIREQVARYITDEIDAVTLEDWLEDASWETGQTGEMLAADALRLLAEYANGDWTKSELREQLGALSRTYRLEQAPRWAFTDSSAQVIRQDQPLVGAGTQRVAASV